MEYILIVVVLVVLVVWLINQLSIDAQTRKAINIIVTVLLVLWLLSYLFGYPLMPHRWAR